MSNFGKKLRDLRKAAGLTQAALGKKVGVHPVSIAQYEAGTCAPREERAAKILAFFHRREKTAAPPNLAHRPCRPPRGRSRKNEVKQAEKVQAELPGPRKTGPSGDRSFEVSKTPARLGIIERDWLDGQIETHVRSCGFMLHEGHVSLVIMKRQDLGALCRLMLKVGGVQVRGE